MENLDPLCSASSNINGAVAMHNSMALTQITQWITMWPRNSTLGYTPQSTESRNLNRYLYTHIHNALFTTIKRWKQPSCPSVDEYTNCGIYTQWKSDTCYNMENPEDMLNEVTQIQRPNIVWFQLYEVLRVVKFIETASRMVIVRDWGKRGWEITVLCMSFSLGR